MIVNITADNMMGKKIVRCSTIVKWWDDYMKTAIAQSREIHRQNWRVKTEGNWDE